MPLNIRTCIRCKELYDGNNPSVASGGRALGGLCQGLCNGCIADYYREQSLVFIHRARVKKKGLPHDLTLAEWIQTLNDFKWMCAYCLTLPYQELDHFIPISLGGGSTASNCVPSCHNCHTYKTNKHPDTLTHP